MGDRPVSWLTEDGILCHDLTGYRHLSMDLIRYLSRQHVLLTDGRPARVMVLADDLLTVDFEVQLFASRAWVSKLIASLAVVCHSFVIQHLTSMFISYHAPSYPVRVFTCRQEAEDWSRSVTEPDKR